MTQNLLAWTGPLLPWLGVNANEAMIWNFFLASSTESAAKAIKS